MKSIRLIVVALMLIPFTSIAADCPGCTATPGTIITNVTPVGSTPSQSAITPLQVDPAIFSAQTPNGVTVGPQSVLITFANRFTPATSLAVFVTLTNASFSTIGSITFYDLDPHLPGNVGILRDISPTGCVTTITNNEISVSSCTFSGISGLDGIGAMVISGITYTKASALAVPGQSIKMVVQIANGKNTAQVFELSAPFTVAQSTGSGSGTGSGGTGGTGSGTTPPVTYSLRTSTSGTGGGTVTTSPAGTSFTSGTSVTLTATPNTGSSFSGWSGACTGTSPTCQITMNATQTVAATFYPSLRAGLIFSTAQNTSQSFLRFYNSGTTAGAVTVTLADPVSGATLARWTSLSVPVGTAPQVSISQIEAAATSSFIKPSYYSATIVPEFVGTFQHALWRTADGTLTNLSTCSSGVTAPPKRLTNVHSSLIGDAGYPSSVVIYNTGTTAASAELSVYNSTNATLLGTFISGSIQPTGQIVVPIVQIEESARIFPSVSAIPHYVIGVQSQFTGYLQHLVFNQRAGVTSDMTTVCGF